MNFQEWWDKYTSALWINSKSVTSKHDLSFARYVWDEAQPRWQPIETALEGEILIRFKDGSVMSHTAEFYRVWQRNKEKHNLTIHDNETPTHWMPLPQPPAPEDQGK